MFGSILIAGKRFALLVSATMIAASLAGTVSADASFKTVSRSSFSSLTGNLSTIVPGPIAGAYFPISSPQTGGAFLDFFNRHGGLKIFGVALSDQMQENGRTVQYFERQRFEYYPENNGTGNEVHLSPLGVAAASGYASTARIAPFQSGAERLFVAETGHSMSNIFLDFWRANGGVRVLGYPISEPLRENGLLVQYYQRARMEFHPEGVAKGFAVQLGLLGSEYIRSHPEVSAAIATASLHTMSVAAQKIAITKTSSQVTDFGQELFNRINGARRAGGLRPVDYSRSVSNLALYRSNDMATRNYFSHNPPGGKNFLVLLSGAPINFQFAGEIISWNNYPQSQTSLVAYNDFMNSPHHHDIIMDPRYSIAGVGVAKANDGKYYYTVLFVQP
jgi:uncharacterized protein YkwD